MTMMDYQLCLEHGRMGLFKYSLHDTGLGSESWPVSIATPVLKPCLSFQASQWPYPVSATIPYVGKYIVFLILCFYLSLWLVPVGFMLCLPRTDFSNIGRPV